MFRKAAEGGSAEAQHNLSLLCEDGRGVRRDLREAGKWRRLAAEQGFAPAQYNLGLDYWEGRGVTRDPVEAARWFMLAEAAGYAQATHNLELVRKALTPEEVAESGRRADAFAAQRAQRVGPGNASASGRAR